MKSGLGGLRGTAAAFDEDPSPPGGRPGPARAPRREEGPSSIPRNSSSRRTDSGVVSVISHSPDPPRPLVFVAAGSSAALRELSSALGEWGLRTAGLSDADLKSAGLESAALGDPPADAVILLAPPTVTEAGATCRRLRAVAGSSPAGVEDVLLAPAEVMAADATSPWPACRDAKKGCFASTLSGASIDAIVAGPETGNSSASVPAWAFRCVWEE